MKVESVVKVMNFHALLRVNNARRKVEKAYEYEEELKHVISSIVANRIFRQERVSLEMNEKAKELNVYIGSDLGFCANFNADIIRAMKDDKDENDKIIIGSRVRRDMSNNLLMIDKADFAKREGEISQIILDGILNNRYSRINIIYIHYYNMSRQEIVKKTILPFDYVDEADKKDENNIDDEDDFVVEGDLSYIIWNLISIYVSTEIKIAEAWSWASENVERQVFTDQSLKKIEERKEVENKVLRKKKRLDGLKMIIDLNNQKMEMREK